MKKCVHRWLIQALEEQDSAGVTLRLVCPITYRQLRVGNKALMGETNNPDPERLHRAVVICGPLKMSPHPTSWD